MDDLRRWTPYCGEGPGPAEWLSRWNLDPPLLIALALAAAFIGHRRAWSPRHPLVQAWALVAFLYVSPVCALASTFFSVRVAHHLLLVLVVAPLLVRAAPLPTPGGGPGLGLWTGAALTAGFMWLWHLPSAYALALSSDAAWLLMQSTLLAGAWVFWRGLRCAPVPSAVLALLGLTVVTGLLGAWITLAEWPMYAPHRLPPLAWGVDPLDDQRLAGLTMWIPGGFAFLGVALLIGGRTMNAAPPGRPAPFR